MPNFWLLSDPHFGHSNILNFESSPGVKLRPFSCIEEHDETIVQNHNKVVKPQDHYYCLGDVVINKRYLDIVKRLNGHKRLIMGNHDIFDTELYLKAGFDKVMACRVLDGIIITHIPVHADQLRRFKINVHGHLHSNRVMHRTLTSFGKRVPDPRYHSVCCEHVNYTPISLETIKKQING